MASIINRFFFVLSLLYLVIIPLQAQEGNIQAAFIEDIVGARAWGLGGAYRTLVNDANSLIWNPAGLADIKGKNSLTLDHVELMEFFSYSYLGYAHRLNDRWSLGTGLLYSGDEIMSEFVGYLSVGIDGSVIGDAFFNGTIPKEMISVGISNKILYSSYGKNDPLPDLPPYLQGHQVSGSALGYALDLGFKVSPSHSDHFSLTIKNILSHVTWDSDNEAGTALGRYYESLPLTTIVGYARQQDRLTFAVELDKSLYSDVEDNLHLGMEYQLLREFALRAGYAQELVTADSQRLALGAGFNIDMETLPFLRFDIAYLINLDWEDHNSLLFSLTLPAF